MKKKMTVIFILAFAAVLGGIALIWAVLSGGGNGGKNGGAYSQKLIVESGAKRHEFMVEVADTFASRMRGLSGRAELAENRGMYFVFDSAGAHGFWMKDMRFPIDIVWIRDGKIVGFTENVAPEPEKSLLALTVYYPPEPADRVLEVSTGLVKKLQLNVGDSVSLLPKEKS